MKSARLNVESTKKSNREARTLEEDKRRLLMRRLRKLLPVEELARIYRAQHGDKEAQKITTLQECCDYICSDSFVDFLAVNRLPVYEQVLR